MATGWPGWNGSNRACPGNAASCGWPALAHQGTWSRPGRSLDHAQSRPYRCFSPSGSPPRPGNRPWWWPAMPAAGGTCSALTPTPAKANRSWRWPPNSPCPNGCTACAPRPGMGSSWSPPPAAKGSGNWAWWQQKARPTGNPLGNPSPTWLASPPRRAVWSAWPAIPPPRQASWSWRSPAASGSTRQPPPAPWIQQPSANPSNCGSRAMAKSPPRPGFTPLATAATRRPRCW